MLTPQQTGIKAEDAFTVETGIVKTCCETGVTLVQKFFIILRTK